MPVEIRDGDPETLFWVFSPRLSKKPVLHALVRDSESREVAALTEPGTISNAFSARQRPASLRRVPVAWDDARVERPSVTEAPGLFAYPSWR